jgi:hypothetical protein
LRRRTSTGPAPVAGHARTRGHKSHAWSRMQTFQPTEKWDYAYAGVFEGMLSECVWKTGAKCALPLTGNDCFKVTCQTIDFECPPPGQDVCPHWTNISCGNIPGTNRPYWAHKCSPLALPTLGKVSDMTCNSTADANGTFQCYFSQVRPCPLKRSLCAQATCLYRAGTGRRSVPVL